MSCQIDPEAERRASAAEARRNMNSNVAQEMGEESEQPPQLDTTPRRPSSPSKIPTPVRSVSSKVVPQRNAIVIPPSIARAEGSEAFAAGGITTPHKVVPETSEPVLTENSTPATAADAGTRSNPQAEAQAVNNGVLDQSRFSTDTASMTSKVEEAKDQMTGPEAETNEVTTAEEPYSQEEPVIRGGSQLAKDEKDDMRLKARYQPPISPDHDAFSFQTEQSKHSIRDLSALELEEKALYKPVDSTSHELDTTNHNNPVHTDSRLDPPTDLGTVQEDLTDLADDLRESAADQPTLPKLSTSFQKEVQSQIDNARGEALTPASLMDGKDHSKKITAAPDMGMPQPLETRVQSPTEVEEEARALKPDNSDQNLRDAANVANASTVTGNVQHVTDKVPTEELIQQVSPESLLLKARKLDKLRKFVVRTPILIALVGKELAPVIRTKLLWRARGVAPDLSDINGVAGAATATRGATAGTSSMPIPL